jgi:phage terminase small subunit
MQELRTRNQALIEANEELQVEKEVLEGRIEELQQRERRLAQTLRKREFELRQQEIQIRDLADLRDQRNAARSQVRALQEKIAELRLRLEGSSASDSEP